MSDPTLEEIRRFADFCAGGYLGQVEIQAEWLTDAGRERMRVALLAALAKESTSDGASTIDPDSDIDAVVEMLRVTENPKYVSVTFLPDASRKLVALLDELRQFRRDHRDCME